MSGMFWFGVLMFSVGFGCMAVLQLYCWLKDRRCRNRIKREYEGLGLRVGFVDLDKGKDKEG